MKQNLNEKIKKIVKQNINKMLKEENNYDNLEYTNNLQISITNKNGSFVVHLNDDYTNDEIGTVKNANDINECIQIITEYVQDILKNDIIDNIYV